MVLFPEKNVTLGRDRLILKKFVEFVARTELCGVEMATFTDLANRVREEGVLDETFENAPVSGRSCNNIGPTKKKKKKK